MAWYQDLNISNSRSVVTRKPCLGGLIESGTCRFGSKTPDSDRAELLTLTNV